MEYKPKIQTPENTVTHTYTKEDLEKQKSFVMCPTSGCTAELKGSWKDYEVYIKDKNGKVIKKKENGLQVYRCPVCEKEFTVNNFSINSIPVPDVDGIGVIIKGESILYRVNGFERFHDADGETYVYLPLKYVTEHNRFFYVQTDNPEVSDDELKELIKNHLSKDNK